ncbi:kinase-like domain-containing protein [Syncephalis fuscata]|nr:kinase-like domain-containing protein [Syncephalis fuscata]
MAMATATQAKILPYGVEPIKDGEIKSKMFQTIAMNAHEYYHELEIKEPIGEKEGLIVLTGSYKGADKTVMCTTIDSIIASESLMHSKLMSKIDESITPKNSGLFYFVEFHGIFRYKDAVCFIKSYFGEKTLFQYASSLTVKEKGQFLPKLIFTSTLAVGYIHYCGVTLRNINANNIFISDSHDRAKPWLVLGDFSSAQSVNKIQNVNSPSFPLHGNIKFYAPENFTKQISEPFSQDAWAIGVCIYYLLSGKTPFDKAIEALHHTPTALSLRMLLIRSGEKSITPVTNNPEELSAWKDIIGIMKAFMMPKYEERTLPRMYSMQQKL